METTLEDLKEPWLDSNTSPAFPRPLPDRLSDMADVRWSLTWCTLYYWTRTPSYVAKEWSKWSGRDQHHECCGRPLEIVGWVVVRRVKANLMGIKQYPWVPINTFRNNQSGDDVSPWSMHDCITITPYCVMVVCSYCSCFMTHFRLLLADMIIHDFYSFHDSWPLLWPTIDLFLLSVRPTLSNNIHFLYHHCSIFRLIVGFLQNFRWSVHNTYPKTQYYI